MRKRTPAEAARAIDDLASIVNGLTRDSRGRAILHTVQRTAARSGWSETVDVYGIDATHGSLLYLTGRVADALNEKRTEDGTLRLHGLGLDRAEFLVMRVSRVVAQQDYALRHERI